MIRLLLIDDDHDDYLITMALLKSNPEVCYHIEWADDYESGIRMAIQGVHDVILVDYRLGHRDGLELIRDAMAWGCMTPLILMTGQTGREIDIAAMETGAVGFLAKADLHPRQLERSIRYAIHRSRNESVLRSRSFELEADNRRLVQLSTTDPLTGLANRRRFIKSLKGQLSLATRLSLSVSLTLIDIDRFKIYNDTFGHPAGDETLRCVAGILNAEARAYDLVARLGGEEFAIILPATNHSAARSFSSRLCQVIAGYAWQLSQVTISAGVATASPGRTGADELISWADRALYRSKQGGKNQSIHHIDIPCEISAGPTFTWQSIN